MNWGKYLIIQREIVEKRKTPIYHLYSQNNEEIKLGEIKWYGRWRKYCFFPENETIWDIECLNSAVSFINYINVAPDESALQFDSCDKGKTHYTHNDKLKIIKNKASLICDIGFDYDGYNDADNLKKIIDELVSYSRDIIKIIKNIDN